jgi:hypothetical protein
VSGRNSPESEPFFTRASTPLLHRRNATGSRPPPGTDPRCSQTKQQRQGSSTREGHGASLAEDRRRITSVTTIGEPRTVGSKTVSSRRARHRSAATARSEDLGFSPGRSRGTEIGLTVPSTRERRPRTPPPWPEGQRFPFGTITAIYTPQHSTRRPPRRPHDRGHRPAPESLARPPTNMTPTFQGRNPGFPTRHRTERKRRRSVASRPPDAERGAGRPSPRHRNRGSPPAAPMAAGDKQIWAKMGSKWARGPCPDPDSRRPDPSRPPHPPRRSSTAPGRTGAAPLHAVPGTYPRRPRLPPPAQAGARAARHHGRSGEQPPSRARPVDGVSAPPPQGPRRRAH